MVALLSHDEPASLWDVTMMIDALIKLSLIALPVYFFFRWVQADSEKDDRPKAKSPTGR